jgi:hypothetical protein
LKNEHYLPDFQPTEPDDDLWGDSYRAEGPPENDPRWRSPQERGHGLAEGSLEPGSYGLTVLPLDDKANGVEGRSWAYVSLIDNLTGDPTNWW